MLQPPGLAVKTGSFRAKEKKAAGELLFDMSLVSFLPFVSKAVTADSETNF